MKGDGGAVGLTENSAELLRWMIAGPEFTRLVYEFESNLPTNQGKLSDTTHHEQNHSYQQRFHNHIKLLVTQIDELGNPFTDTSDQIIVLDSKEVLDQVVSKTVKTIESVGKSQFFEFHESRIVRQEKSVDDIISKNKLPLCNHRPKLKSKQTNEVATMRRNVKMFSQLYIANQRITGYLDTFFSHENSSVPLSLSKDGRLRSGDKSDLLDCLVDDKMNSITENAKPDTDGLIIEGAVLVNIVRPNGQHCFKDYIGQRIMPVIEKSLISKERVDIVWQFEVSNLLSSG